MPPPDAFESPRRPVPCGQAGLDLTPRPSFASEALPLAVIAGVFAAAWFAVSPWGDAPYIDDWVYARVVESWLERGWPEVPAFGAVYPLTQAAWALPFAAAFGFSFVALRLSTIVLAVVGCGAIHLTLRELGVRRAASLLGALALALQPVFFGHAFSFMTEVPFVSLSAVSLWAYVRAVQRDEPGGIWWGGAAAVAAFLVRPLALLLPLAALAVPMGRDGWRSHLRRAGLPLTLTVGAMVALQWTLPVVFGPLDWANTRTENLRWWFTVPMSDYATWTVEALVQAAFPFAPLLIGALVSRRHAAAALILAAVMAAAGLLVHPLPDAQTWSLQEFTARNMLPGVVPPARWGPAAVQGLTALGALVAATLLVVVARGWTRAPGGWGRGEALVAVYGLLQGAAVHVLWLYNDRYYVVLAPPIALLAARAVDATRAGRVVAAALLAVWAVIDVTGARDMLAVNAAAADAVRALEAGGVPPWQIDAGYTLNGWRLYVHPEHLPAGGNPRTDVPRVTAGAGARYLVTNAPEPGATVLREIPLPRATWQATDRLYVVRSP